ncbi:hypothetical protein C5C66_08480 [Rathayibacter toxicus]|uniref:Uncharacterized protein n=1 Tax=Rathayibacter toxicus TaxID=145458 RepID=A0A0C5BFA4_9MICO|nr:hypothetical protein TI83_08625 [Rathayibacter toxicus]ALS57796.1 hypothetical protein APU90_08450 [Rathayibacter toxicus]KKM47366.1 hypothetical protein VT73_00560 [Rathayibacter toxicus]PPH62219.1 hypothetical protein C5D13_08540 [Rathayibacter toxicus]PPH81050.1 hypothetical protein C5D20_08500 [Rathayibacter toxicus]
MVQVTIYIFVIRKRKDFLLLGSIIFGLVILVVVRLGCVDLLSLRGIFAYKFLGALWKPAALCRLKNIG